MLSIHSYAFSSRTSFSNNAAGTPFKRPSIPSIPGDKNSSLLPKAGDLWAVFLRLLQHRELQAQPAQLHVVKHHKLAGSRNYIEYDTEVGQKLPVTGDFRVWHSTGLGGCYRT
jgi:hypothetical protein